MDSDLFRDVTTWSLIDVYRRLIPEDGGSRIPYNFSTLLPNSTASFPITVLRRWDLPIFNCHWHDI